MLLRPSLLTLVALCVSAGILPAFEVQLGRPAPQEIHKLQTVKLAVETAADGGLILRWAPANAAPSDGIKVVVAGHAQPWYPQDHAVQWIPGTGHQTFRLDGHRVDRSRPQHLRVIFVRQGDHDRDHVAVSNAVPLPALHGHGGHVEKGGQTGEWGAKQPHWEGAHQAQPVVEAVPVRDPWQPIATDRRSEPAVSPDIPEAYRGQATAEAIAVRVAELQAQREALAERVAEAEAEATGR